MKVLVIGSGAREHAITCKLKESNQVKELFVAPGNAGISEVANIVDISADDVQGLLVFAKEKQIDLTIVGPEIPLVLGVVDLFKANGLRIFGPDKHGAQFEGSKAFSKAFMARYNIPTADYREFTNVKTAIDSVDIFGYPLVIKADGLAAGKGVVICETKTEAIDTLNEMMTLKTFGNAGSKVVFEEFLTGVEASILCFVDGNHIVPMTSAQDYKKAYDGDLGLNTGGMGAYSPSRLFDEALEAHIYKDILLPFIKGTHQEGIDYRGIIFIGIMVENNQAKVIEFNCRMGDPETQVVLPRLENDLIDVVVACIEGKLDQIELKWSEEQTVAVVLASGGYPGNYEKGQIIKGLDTVNSAIVYHAGTKIQDNELVTNGGRVLSVVAKASSLEMAKELAYKAVDQITFDQMMYRKDITQ